MINRDSWLHNSIRGNTIYVNCMLNIASKKWVPDDDLQYFDELSRGDIANYNCIVVKSKKTCPSTCSGCKEPFVDGTNKYGFPWKSPKGKYGFVNKWYHADCAGFIFCAIINLVECERDTIDLQPNNCANEHFAYVKRDADDPNNLLFSVPNDDPKAWVKLNKPQASDAEKWQEDIDVLINTICFGLPKSGSRKNEIQTAINQIYTRHDKIPKVVLLDASNITVPEPKNDVIPTPTQLLVPLLPFQKDGHDWMVRQEATSVRGGILADEMGMGKTIQTIAMLITQKQKEEAPTRPHTTAAAGDESRDVIYKPEAPPKKRKGKKGQGKFLHLHFKKHQLDIPLKNQDGGTLIICPVVALLQWYNEINTKVALDFFSVVIYHGPYRDNLASVLHKYDIVLTTYSIVECEYRRILNKKKMPCEYCGRMYAPHSLAIHNRYFCGPNASRTEKQQLTQRKYEHRMMYKLAEIAGLDSILTQVSKQRKLDVDDDDDETNGKSFTDGGRGAGTEIVKVQFKSKDYREIVDALCNLGFGVTDVVRAIDENMSNLPGCMLKLKMLSENGKVDVENLDILSAFVDSGDFQSRIKGYKSEQYRQLLTAMGMGSYGKKVEILNRIIIFIKKWQSILGYVETANDDHTAAAESDNVKAKDACNVNKNEDSALVDDASNRDDKSGELLESNLHRIKWKRIIIDEAHRIKTRSSSTAQGIFALRCSHARWCLTGTPLQNRVGDVFSLVRFLHMVPYAYILCNREDCTCMITDLVCSDLGYSKCDGCGHGRVHHYSYFNRHVLNPILYSGYANDGKRAMATLHNDVFKRILLRRTKAEKADDVKLPPLTVRIRRDTMTQEERDFYLSIEQKSQTKFDTYVQTGTLLHNYAHIFDLLTRLRQAVDHPYLIIYGPASMASKALDQGYLNGDVSDDTLKELQQRLPAADARGGIDCCICFQRLEKHEMYCVLKCGHALHQVCLTEFEDSRPPQLEDQSLNCPACYVPLIVKIKNDPRSNHDADLSIDTESRLTTSSSISSHYTSLNTSRGKHGIMKYIDTSQFKSSTKIEALMQDVAKVLTTTTDKCIVFSQYCAMLDLIAFRFKVADIKCATLAGSTSFVARKNILLDFNHSDLRVLLISLKAGGEGLNLQVANHIFLMDPWWNPASELQAIQRAHRIGQTKPVYATRFIISDTIEDKILQLQEKKMIVFDATVASSEQALSRLDSADLAFLFKR